MPIADLEVILILVVATAVPIAICVLVVWLNLNQQKNDQAMLRAAVEREHGAGVTITGIRAGKSDVSFVYAHGLGRYYRVTLGMGGNAVTELWKIDRGECAKAR